MADRCERCDQPRATVDEWKVAATGDVHQKWPDDGKCYGEILYYGEIQGCSGHPFDWRTQSLRRLDLLRGVWSQFAFRRAGGLDSGGLSALEAVEAELRAAGVLVEDGNLKGVS